MPTVVSVPKSAVEFNDEIVQVGASDVDSWDRGIGRASSAIYYCCTTAVLVCTAVAPAQQRGFVVVLWYVLLYRA